MTTTDRDARRARVGLSVIAVSALVLAASYVAVATVDGQQEPLPKPVAAEVRRVQPAPPAAIVTARALTTAVASAGGVHTQPTQAPVRGVRAAPKPSVRRVIVRRRSRAS